MYAYKYVCDKFTVNKWVIKFNTDYERNAYQILMS